MSFLRKGDGFDVWVRTVFLNTRREPDGVQWVVRTNGKAQTDIEMARGLTQDLTRMNVAWEIRNAAGNVVEDSACIQTRVV